MTWRDLTWWMTACVVIVGSCVALALIGCGDPFIEFPGSGGGPGAGGSGDMGGEGPGGDSTGGSGGAADPSCDDGLENGLEDGVDCGGACAACPPDGCLYPHQHLGCQLAYLSDYCPTAERNVHGCVQLNEVSWAASVVVDNITYDKSVNMHAPPFGGDGNDVACTYYDADEVYEEGRGQAHWLLGGEYTSFEAMLGLSQTGPSAPEGSMLLLVRADGVEIYVSPVLAGYDTEELVLDVTGVVDLELVVDNVDGNYVGDRGAWIDARLVHRCAL